MPDFKTVAAILLFVFVAGSFAAPPRPVKSFPTDARPMPSSKARKADIEKARAEKLSSIKTLENELEIQNALFEKHAAELKRQEEATLTALNAFEVETPSCPSNFESLNENRLEAETELRRVKKLYSELINLPLAALPQAISAKYPDEVLDHKLADRVKSQEQLRLIEDAQLKAPLEKFLASLDQEIENRSRSILAGLQISIEARTDLIKTIDDKFETMRTKDAADSKLRENVEKHRRIRNSVYIRLLQEKVDAGIHK